MKITNNEFDALIGDLQASMECLSIGTIEQHDLPTITQTTRKEILTSR